MSKFAPSFPQPPDGSGPWYRDASFETFEEKCSVVPLALLAFGVVVAVSTLCCPAEQAGTSRRVPRCLPFKTWSTILLSLAGLGMYVVWGYFGYMEVDHTLLQLMGDVNASLDNGQQIAALGAEINASLAHCGPANRTEVQAFLEPLQRQLAELLFSIQAYNRDVAIMPAHLESVRKLLEDWLRQRGRGLGMGAPVAPLVLVVLGCLLLCFNVCVARCFRQNCCPCFARCFSKVELCLWRKLGALIFVPLIVVVAAASAVEIGGASALGSFCKDVDSNTLAYVHRFADNVSYHTSRYYIQGNTTNPLLDYIQGANASLLEAAAQLKQHESEIEAACPAASHLSADVAALASPLAAIEELLSAQHVYSYYVSIVRDEACGSVVAALGWLVTIQYLVCIVCLPLLIAASDDAFLELSRDPPARDLQQPLAVPPFEGGRQQQYQGDRDHRV